MRASSRKTLQKRYANDDDLEDILSDEDSVSELSANDSESEKPTLTNTTYSMLMKDPKFLLTLQPRFYENAISSDEEQELDGMGDQKLGNLNGAESMLMLDESQH